MKIKTMMIITLFLGMFCTGLSAIDEKGRLRNGTMTFENNLVSMDLKNEDFDVVISMIAELINLRDRTVEQNNCTQELRRIIIHPDIKNTVSVYMSKVPREQAIERILCLTNVGKITTGMRTPEYPDGNILVFVPAEKMNDASYLSNFVDIKYKKYTGQLICMSITKADIKDVFTLFSEMEKCKLDLHPSCRVRITCLVMNYPADLLQDVVCTLLEYETRTETVNGITSLMVRPAKK